MTAVSRKTKTLLFTAAALAAGAVVVASLLPATHPSEDDATIPARTDDRARKDIQAGIGDASSHFSGVQEPRPAAQWRSAVEDQLAAAYKASAGHSKLSPTERAAIQEGARIFTMAMGSAPATHRNEPAYLAHRTAAIEKADAFLRSTLGVALFASVAAGPEGLASLNAQGLQPDAAAGPSKSPDESPSAMENSLKAANAAARPATQGSSAPPQSSQPLAAATALYLASTDLSQLSERQVAVIEEGVRIFQKSMAAAPTANPQDPAYHNTWKEATQKSDAFLRANFGFQVFSSFARQVSVMSPEEAGLR